ncbi:MAG TPA: (2Fe-2S)-binding protein [Bacteroidota bacterium]|nr:(2Fe-2S)-binding protein [Bacteroidota bacterium]
MEGTVRFTLNGRGTTISVDPQRKLLWVLRTDLGLTGTKYGCGESFCGACTVLVDGEPVRSCQVSMNEIEGKDVVTIEGLERDGTLHPIQKAFAEHDALQCGYCTPGMIMNALGLLKKNPHPSAAELIEGMDNNLCRCGAHNRIVRALETAAGELKGGL